jgi:hypothetical protein
MDSTTNILKFSGTLLIYYEKSTKRYQVLKYPVAIFSSILCVLSDSIYILATASKEISTGPEIVGYFSDVTYHTLFFVIAYLLLRERQSMADIMNALGSRNHRHFCTRLFQFFMFYYFTLIVFFNSFSYGGFAITWSNAHEKILCFFNDMYNCSIYLLMNFMLVALSNMLLMCNERVKKFDKTLTEERVNRVRNFRANILCAQERFQTTFSFLILVIFCERSIFAQINVYYISLAVYNAIMTNSDQLPLFQIVQLALWFFLDMSSVCVICINCNRVMSEVIKQIKKYFNFCFYILYLKYIFKKRRT